MQALIIKNKKIRSNWATPNFELNSFIEAALAKSKLVSGCGATYGPKDSVKLGSMVQAIKSAKSKIRNICVVTGRTRANHLEYKVSRLKLKNFAEAGLIPGLKKL